MPPPKALGAPGETDTAGGVADLLRVERGKPFGALTAAPAPVGTGLSAGGWPATKTVSTSASVVSKMIRFIIPFRFRDFDSRPVRKVSAARFRFRRPSSMRAFPGHAAREDRKYCMVAVV